MLTIRKSVAAVAWLICLAVMTSGQTPLTVVTFDVTNGLRPYFGAPRTGGQWRLARDNLRQLWNDRRRDSCAG
jgi:hypothetical protein